MFEEFLNILFTNSKQFMSFLHQDFLGSTDRNQDSVGNGLGDAVESLIQQGVV